VTGPDRIYRHRRGDARILEALLAGSSYVQAAAFAGVGEKTVRRRMADPAFRRELMRHQDEVLGRARRRLIALIPGAVNTVRDLADDAEVPAATRLRACEVILSRADPVPARVETAVTVAASPDDRTARQVLAEALERARTRLGYDDEAVALSGHGYRSNGDG
jgi:hypothetical protein